MIFNCDIIKKTFNTALSKNVLSNMGLFSFRPANDVSSYNFWRSGDDNIPYGTSFMDLNLFCMVLKLKFLLKLVFFFRTQRFYSISSSPAVHANKIHITVAVVEYNKRGKYKLQDSYVLFHFASLFLWRTWRKVTVLLDSGDLRKRRKISTTVT